MAEPWPSLKDPEFIEFMQQYPSRLCKRTHMVLRHFAHGFIACKYSALAYLIIGILWLDRTKSKEEKMALLTKFDIRRFGAFQNKQLESIFMQNKKADPSKVIMNFDDIVFEDNIALFGIVDSDGQIFHYFLLVQLPTGEYSVISSYGSDSVSIYQYETTVTPAFFTNFVKSLKKEKKTTTDQKRIRGFMRAHFLNPLFQLVQRKTEKESSPMNTPQDIHDEIERYVVAVSHTIQFQSILPAIQEELSRYEPETAEPEKEESIAELLAAETEAEAEAALEEAEELKRVEETSGGMRKKRTRKGKRTHYVRSRRMYRRTLHKK